MADNNERVERRSGPADRRSSQSDRRGKDRVIEEPETRRKNPDRRKSQD